MIPTEFPETPAALYDMLHEKFGIGDYDSIGRPAPPWFKARMREIAKLKSQLKARRATPRQVAIAVWHAERTGVRIRWTSDLFRLIPEAMKAYNEAQDAQRRAVELSDREAVIAEAVDAGDMAFAQQLYNAGRDEGNELIARWRSRHG